MRRAEIINKVIKMLKNICVEASFYRVTYIKNGFLTYEILKLLLG